MYQIAKFIILTVYSFSLFLELYVVDTLKIDGDLPNSQILVNYYGYLLYILLVTISICVYGKTVILNKRLLIAKIINNSENKIVRIILAIFAWLICVIISSIGFLLILFSVFQCPFYVNFSLFSSVLNAYLIAALYQKFGLNNKNKKKEIGLSNLIYLHENFSLYAVLMGTVLLLFKIYLLLEMYTFYQRPAYKIEEKSFHILVFSAAINFALALGAPNLHKKLRRSLVAAKLRADTESAPKNLLTKLGIRKSNSGPFEGILYKTKTKKRKTERKLKFYKKYISIPKDLFNFFIDWGTDLLFIILLIKTFYEYNNYSNYKTVNSVTWTLLVWIFMSIFFLAIPNFFIIYQSRKDLKSYKTSQDDKKYKKSTKFLNSHFARFLSLLGLSPLIILLDLYYTEPETPLWYYKAARQKALEVMELFFEKYPQLFIQAYIYLFLKWNEANQQNLVDFRSSNSISKNGTTTDLDFEISEAVNWAQINQKFTKSPTKDIPIIDDWFQQYITLEHFLAFSIATNILRGSFSFAKYRKTMMTLGYNQEKLISERENLERVSLKNRERIQKLESRNKEKSKISIASEKKLKKLNRIQQKLEENTDLAIKAPVRYPTSKLMMVVTLIIDFIAQSLFAGMRFNLLIFIFTEVAKYNFRPVFVGMVGLFLHVLFYFLLRRFFENLPKIKGYHHIMNYLLGMNKSSKREPTNSEQQNKSYKIKMILPEKHYFEDIFRPDDDQIVAEESRYLPIYSLLAHDITGHLWLIILNYLLFAIEYLVQPESWNWLINYHVPNIFVLLVINFVLSVFVMNLYEIHVVYEKPIDSDEN